MCSLAQQNHNVYMENAQALNLFRVVRAAGALCFSLAISLAGAQTNVLRIGVIGPFTGSSADFGMPMLQGIQLAVEEINMVGGYLGRPIELVIKDDKADPDEGLKQSQALVAEKVAIAIGFATLA